jgi:hypothetical protein
LFVSVNANPIELLLLSVNQQELLLLSVNQQELLLLSVKLQELLLNEWNKRKKGLIGAIGEIKSIRTKSNLTYPN